MSYEFQSTLHDNIHTAHLAVASEWISAGGMNDQDSIIDILSQYSDAEIADECEEAWDMTGQREDDKEVWYDRDLMLIALAEVREYPEDAFLNWSDK